jgi:chitodextrinase
MGISRIIFISVLLSFYLTGQSQDTQNPEAPANLISNNITINSVDLSWDASSDNVGVTGYIIYNDTDSLTTVATLSHTLTGLNSSTDYAFHVIAFDAAGNRSGASNIVNVRTLDAPDIQNPTIPSGLASHDITTTGVRLTWNASTDNVGVTGYIVFREGDSIASTTNSILEYTVSGLTPSTNYSFTVSAFDAAGNRSSESIYVSIKTLDPPDTENPVAPSGLASHDITTNGVRLTWNISTDNVGVTGYIVFRDGDSIAITTHPVVVYTISSLSPSTNYIFTVRAFDAAGNRSAESNSINVRTLDPPDTEVPTAPSGLVSRDITSSGVRLTWNASTDNVGVTGYIVFRNGDSIAATTTSILEYTVSGLNPSTNYLFTIKAFDAAGNRSAESNSASVTTLVAPDHTNPTAPGNLTPHDITISSIRLTWIASSDNVGVIGYIVYRGTDSLAQVSTLEYTVNGLLPSTRYLFSVKAKDAAGNKSVSSNVIDTLTTRDMVAPSIPAGLTANDLTTTSVRLTWNPSTDNVGVTGYLVYRGSDSIGSVTGLQYPVTGLTPSTPYSFTIRARDAAGNHSNSSQPLLVTTPAETDFISPTSPSNLIVSNITVNSARLSWNASTDNVGVTGYVVYRGSDSLTTVTTLEYNITGLTPSTTYTFSIKAKDAAGNKSTASIIIFATISDITPPTAPANLAGNDITISSVRLSWSASTDNVGVIGYVVYRGSDSLTTITTLGCTIGGLSLGTTYSFSVRAKDAAGNKSVASTITVITSTDVTAPSTPTGLTGNNVTTTSVRLIWTASSDNIGVIGYIVYRGNDSLTSVAGTEYIVNGLAPSTNFSFRVKSRDAAGNKSGFSNTVNIRTLDPVDITAPSAPANLGASNITTTSVRLFWNASTDNVGVTGYIIYRGSDSLTIINSLEYVVSGLTPSTHYSFTVKAKDAAGNKSVSSNILSIKTHIPPDVESPTAPTNLTSHDITATSVRLTWNASTDNVKVTGYQIFVNESLLSTAKLTEYTITGLVANSTYSLYVKAYDGSANKSAPSNIIEVTTQNPDIVSPTAPGALTSNNLTTSSVHLTWSASTDNIGVTGYIIYRNGDSIATIAGLEYTAGGLTPSTSYSFYIKATDATGNKSNSSNIVIITTLDPPDLTSPTAPGDLSSNDITYSSVRLTWDASSDNIGVVGYRIYRNGGLIAITASLEYVIQNLKSSTSYSFSVRAYDAAGNVSASSNIVEVITPQSPDVISPTAPTSLTASDLTATSIHLTWNASTDNYGVAGYRIYANNSMISTTELTQYTINGLESDSTYYIFILAYDAANNLSDTSNILGIKTPEEPDITPPSKPIGLTVYSLTKSSISFRWEPSSDNKELLGYQIYVNNILITTTEFTEFSLIDLIENTYYTFYVRAIDVSGNVSDPSIKITASTNGTITGTRHEKAEMFVPYYFNIGDKWLNVKVPVELGPVELVEIYNVTGSKILMTTSIQENNIINLDQTSIDKGFYIIVLSGNTLQHTTKFLY